MPIDAPAWASPDEIAEHGALFLAAVFSSRAHFEHAKGTGFADLRRPSSARRAAKQAADPVAMARDALRKRAEGIRRGIADAERRIAQAHADGAASPLLFGATAELTIKAQSARLEERRAALKHAKVDLELFDCLHPR